MVQGLTVTALQIDARTAAPRLPGGKTGPGGLGKKKEGAHRSRNAGTEPGREEGRGATETPRPASDRRICRPVAAAGGCPELRSFLSGTTFRTGLI